MIAVRASRCRVRNLPAVDAQGAPLLSWSFRPLPEAGPVTERFHAALALLIERGRHARSAPRQAPA